MNSLRVLAGDLTEDMLTLYLGEGGHRKCLHFLTYIHHRLVYDVPSCTGCHFYFPKPLLLWILKEAVNALIPPFLNYCHLWHHHHQRQTGYLGTNRIATGCRISSRYLSALRLPPMMSSLVLSRQEDVAAHARNAKMHCYNK